MDNQENDFDKMVEKFCDTIEYDKEECKEILSDIKHDYVRLLIDSKDSDSKKIMPMLDFIDILITTFS